LSFVVTHKDREKKRGREEEKRRRRRKIRKEQARDKKCNFPYVW